MFDLISVLAETTTTSGNGNTGGFNLGSLGMFIPLILMFVAMYFLMIRPQKKKQKEEQKMRESIRVGDEITTIGGIRGRIVNIKEDEFVIESGADRSKIVIKKWALQSCDTVHDATDDDDDDDDDI